MRPVPPTPPLKKLVIGMLLCSAFAGAQACPGTLKIEALLQHKAEYAGKAVCAVGRLRVQFEGDQISLGPHRVFLSLFTAPYTDASVNKEKQRRSEWKRRYQGKCVVVQGTFDPEDTGHLGMWPAGIRDIERISLAPRGSCPS